MAELIQKQDTLNEGRVKINAAITDAEQAKVTAGEADNKATQALANSESTQTQLDTIVIDGDSSVEAAQARVDEKGVGHTTLKDRIDDGFTKVTSQLAETQEELSETKKSIRPLIIDNWQLNGRAVSGGYEQKEWDPKWGAHFGEQGRTLITPRRAVRQTGKIYYVLINVHTLSEAKPDWKFKVFRFNKTTNQYDFVAERTVTPTKTGHNTFVFETPIDVMAGDVPGLYGPDNIANVGTTNIINPDVFVATGDVKSSNSFTETRNYFPEFECYSSRPFLTVTGSSTLAGHNAGDYWWSSIEYNAPTKTVPGGRIESEVMYQMKKAEPSLEYQNFGKGSSTYEFVSQEGIDIALSVNPHTVAIYSGTNDIALGRRFADLEIDLDTIKSKFDNSNSKRLIICELLPWTNGSDAQAGQLRDWNSRLANWCDVNDVEILKWHDDMGQIRPSTGELDDQKDEYNQDGIHWTQAGVNKLAELLLDKL